MSTTPSVVVREKQALATHRAALRGSDLPPPKDAPKGTFLHGFFLPFSLIAATMRDRELRRPYLRVVLLRGLLVVAIGAIAIAKGDINVRSKGAESTAGEKQYGPRPGFLVHRSKRAHGEKPAAAVHVDIPGVKVDIDPESDAGAVSILGQAVPVTQVHDDDPAGDAVVPAPEASAIASAAASAAASTAPSAAPSGPPSLARRVWNTVRHSWAWLLTLLAFLSATEGVIVFFSRRWDDWLSFHASRLAAIVPEDETPKTPKIALDLGWLYRKLKRRARGYIVFAAGLPALLPLRLVPSAGDVLFTIAATLWGWYWLGVFSAAKSAHAWADEEKALSPAPIRTLNDRLSPSPFFAPLRWYGRLWAKITHSVNPAATTFERSPWAFLGLALARVILSLPGLYLLARPIVPVAAGRLCAEADPGDRFSVQRAAA